MKHLSPDVSFLLGDPDLGAQVFTVRRRSGSWNQGRFEQTETRVEVSGLAQPAGEHELKFLPEADRVSGAMVFYSRTPLHLTRADGTSDEIEWNGGVYRLTRVEPWVDHGYVRAYGVGGRA